MKKITAFLLLCLLLVGIGLSSSQISMEDNPQPHSIKLNLAMEDNPQPHSITLTLAMEDNPPPHRITKSYV